MPATHIVSAICALVLICTEGSLSLAPPGRSTADSTLQGAPERCRRAVLESLEATRPRSHYRKLIKRYCSAIEVVASPDTSFAVKAGRDTAERRGRREIYSPDTRKPVHDHLYHRYPFSSVVKLSTGCSGALISPHHVLTAAHCMHIDGKYSGVRVGQPETLAETRDRIGASLQRFAASLRSYHWHATAATRVPLPWERATARKPVSDYGLVTLNPDECILSSYIRMQPMSLRTLRSLAGLGGRILHFTSFSDDKPRGTLWYRNCGVSHVDDGGMIYYSCDATFGSSGALVYAYVVDGRHPVTNERIVRRRVVGINSGNRVYINSRGEQQRLNVATGITPERYRQICSWAPDMCDIPDYKDRAESSSWVSSCGGAPTTPGPPETGATPSAFTTTTTALPTTATTTTTPPATSATLAATAETRETTPAATTTGHVEPTPGAVATTTALPAQPDNGSNSQATTGDAPVVNNGTGASGHTETPPPAHATSSPGTVNSSSTMTAGAARTTQAPRTTEELSRFFQFCIGLGASLRQECLRYADRLNG